MAEVNQLPSLFLHLGTHDSSPALQLSNLCRYYLCIPFNSQCWKNSLAHTVILQSSNTGRFLVCIRKDSVALVSIITDYTTLISP